MLTVQWRDNSQNYSHEVEFESMEDAVEEFRARLQGLYAHSGGYVQMNDSDNDEMPVIEWKEGASGGYVCGQAVIDYHPEEDLDLCDEETCEAHDDDNEGLCEWCGAKCRELCFDYLLRDNS